MNARLLVVDDEDALRDLLRDALRFAGYDVTAVARGGEALSAVAEGGIDLLILDVNLPDIDGFEVCRQLRARGETVPVIFLTARDDPDGLRTGFTRGGDDYLTKPFSLEELRLRIDAVLRRTKSTVKEAIRLTCEDIALDEDAHRVWRGSEEIDLSATEFRLLRYLLVNRGAVVSRMQILDHVWQYDFGGDAQIVATYISYLRKKLHDLEEPYMIRTVRGVGYTIRPRVEGM